MLYSNTKVHITISECVSWRRMWQHHYLWLDEFRKCVGIHSLHTLDWASTTPASTDHLTSTRRQDIINGRPHFCKYISNTSNIYIIHYCYIGYQYCESPPIGYIYHSFASVLVQCFIFFLTKLFRCLIENCLPLQE